MIGTCVVLIYTVIVLIVVAIILIVVAIILIAVAIILIHVAIVLLVCRIITRIIIGCLVWGLLRSIWIITRGPTRRDIGIVLSRLIWAGV